MSSLLAPVINLTILLSVIFYYLRTPLKNYFISRQTTMSDELRAIRQRFKDAQEKYEEFSAKLKAVHAETLAIQDQARKEAETIQTKIVSQAKETSALILSDARTRVVTLLADCKLQLQSEFGLKIATRAEQLICEKLTGDDRVRIRREFSQQVGSVQ